MLHSVCCVLCVCVCAIRVVYSDTSSTGFGGYCIEHSEEDTTQSSTWRELKAVQLVLDTIFQKAGFDGSQSTRILQE